MSEMFDGGLFGFEEFAMRWTCRRWKKMWERRMDWRLVSIFSMQIVSEMGLCGHLHVAESCDERDRLYHGVWFSMGLHA